VAQFFRFGLVGTLGFITDAGVLWLLLQVGVGPYVGRIFSFLCGSTVTWALNRRFTFRHAGGGSGQWLRYVLLTGIGAGINYGTYVLCLQLSADMRAMPVAAVAVGSVTAMFFNFFISKYAVFR